MPKNGGEGGHLNSTAGTAIIVEYESIPSSSREFSPRNRSTNGIAFTNGIAAL